MHQKAVGEPTSSVLCMGYYHYRCREMDYGVQLMDKTVLPLVQIV